LLKSLLIYQKQQLFSAITFAVANQQQASNFTYALAAAIQQNII